MERSKLGKTLEFISKNKYQMYTILSPNKILCLKNRK